MNSNVLFKEYCDSAEYEENRNSAQRIVSAMMEVIDKQLRDSNITTGQGKIADASKETK